MLVTPVDLYEHCRLQPIELRRREGQLVRGRADHDCDTTRVTHAVVVRRHHNPLDPGRYLRRVDVQRIARKRHGPARVLRGVVEDEVGVSADLAVGIEEEGDQVGFRLPEVPQPYVERGR